MTTVAIVLLAIVSVLAMVFLVSLILCGGDTPKCADKAPPMQIGG